MWGDTLASIHLEYNYSCYALLVTECCSYCTFLSWSAFDHAIFRPMAYLKVIVQTTSPYALSILIDSGDVRINGVVFNPLD